MAVLDLRRTDQRTNIRLNPLWVVSSVITKDADDAEAILFSFPLAGGDYVIHNIMLDCTAAFATTGTADLLVGYGTIATDAITTGGAITETDDNEYFVTHEPATGYSFPLVAEAQTGSDFAVDRSKYHAQTIVGADADVPCIYASLTADAAITAGAARIHVLMSKIQS
jgi:hypothetical protein